MINADRSQTQEIERAYVNKVMKRLGPFIAILYIFCLLDRGNVANAALKMVPDLGFTKEQYGLGVGLFFVGYFLFEIPSNLIMERVGARRWIFRIMITWGLISAAMMFMRTPGHFYTLRILLGLAEAGFFPGVILYFTYWIPATSRARAIGRFLALTAILGLFGGPLAAFLMQYPLFGLKSWQWLFLVEGIPSVLLGFAVLAILPDKPKNASWLTGEEKRWIEGRLAEEAAHKETVQHFSWRVALTEPRIWLMILVFILSSTAGNAVGFFGPLLLKARSGGLWPDWLVLVSLATPEIAGAIAMTLAAGHSDRTGLRRQHVLFGYIVASLGFLACVFAPTAAMVVAALSLNKLGERVGAGSYWALTTNLLGARAAAGGIAMINSIGNLGGFFGPTLMGYLTQRSGGSYTTGLSTAAALMLVSALLGGMMRGHPTHHHTQVEAEEKVGTSG